MEYFKIIFLAMIPVIELRGAIPIGIALGLNPLGVFIASVFGSTIISIPLLLTFRHILHFLKTKDIFKRAVKFIDNKINRKIKKLKSVSMIGIAIFVGIPLPATGVWTAAAISSILRMRIKDCLIGILIGNMIAGCIISTISLQLMRTSHSINKYYSEGSK